MKRRNHNPDELLDRLTQEIRHETPASAVVNEAAERVWARLARELTEGQIVMAKQNEQIDTITGCADFQALMPAYLGNELSGARRLLLEDHARECLPCRRALKSLREADAPATVETRPLKGGLAGRLAGMSASQRSVLRWAIAAVLVIGLGLAAAPFIERFIYSFRVLNTVVEAASGPVYRVNDNGSAPLAIGEQVAKGEKLRTAKEAGAVVRLPDGSRIELRERSEFWISENAQGTTIHLERGNIIVQAAKQRNKHLFVATPDSLVSVTGTIFSVNAGTKGSRVSVLEGEVHVNYSGREVVLRPGDQETTSQSLERVPLRQEVSWSRDAAKYAQMLEELRQLKGDLDRVPRPGLRYSTRLLELVPDNAVFYVAIPNLSETLAESNRLIQERLAQNPALKAWWAKEGNAKEVNQAVERIREFGQYLGSEIVIAASINGKNDLGEPLVLAELRDPAGFRAYAESQLQQLQSAAADETKENRRHATVRFVADPLKAAAEGAKGKGEMTAWINGDLLIASPSFAAVQRLADRMTTQSAARAGNDFHNTIASLYSEGAGLIIAVDLARIIANELGKGSDNPRAVREKTVAQQLGLTSFRYFIAELKEKDGRPYNRAVVTFNEPGRGIASWLAAPNPMGALDFISPDASVVAAFVVRKPSLLVDDIFAAISTTDAGFAEQLRQFEAEHGLSIRNDLAEPLGGEFAFAIDGPVVPLPSWKMVFEVYDQAHLQQSLEKVADELNKWAATHDKKGVAWEKTESGGRTFYTLRSLDYGLELNYAFVSGYFVAGPSRAMVERAIQYRESGNTLKSSARFRAALPEDGNANFSALFWNNLGKVVAPVARQMGGFSERLPEEQRQMMKSLGEGTPAMLAYAYSYGDRMVFSLSTENGPFGLTPGSLLSLPGQAMFGNIFGRGKVQ
ncbi:MAG TPA: FecR domain-containing protein [Blastocatellia bacterium]|nr:FecR domain-containing protein [Blastocatellia bacterium]